MSAAARGAAGYQYFHRHRKRKVPVIEKKDGDVRTLAQTLITRFGVKPERAWQLAEEQAQKRFPKVAA